MKHTCICDPPFVKIATVSAVAPALDGVDAVALEACPAAWKVYSVACRVDERHSQRDRLPAVGWERLGGDCSDVKDTWCCRALNA